MFQKSETDNSFGILTNKRPPMTCAKKPLDENNIFKKQIQSKKRRHSKIHSEIHSESENFESTSQASTLKHAKNKLRKNDIDV